MTEESLLRDLGENKSVQWYELHPDRLREEIDLMRSAYPAFTLHQQKGENVYWTGRIVALKNDGSELKSLNVKIECAREYPVIFPRVHDVDNELTRRKCPHLIMISDNHYTLCYGNKLDSEIDFFGSIRIKDVVDFATIFLFRQWHFERYGWWPHGQPHREIAFLSHEINRGTIAPDALCPCGMNMMTYRDCHMRAVAAILVRWDGMLTDVRLAVPKVGRNDLCPCGSGQKSKKCCFSKLNHPSSRVFLALKYPTAFAISDEVREFLKKLIV